MAYYSKNYAGILDSALQQIEVTEFYHTDKTPKTSLHARTSNTQ